MIITGVPSGDLECWCFNVTAEDFKRVTGKEPDELDQARFPKGEYKYALYPCHLIPQPDDQKGKPITVCIESNITVPVVEKRKCADCGHDDVTIGDCRPIPADGPVWEDLHCETCCSNKELWKPA